MKGKKIIMKKKVMNRYEGLFIGDDLTCKIKENPGTYT